MLTRAVITHHLALAEMGQVWLPVQRTWRLNERHYGALQGLDKKETTERHGAEQTILWRRSYDVPPPPRRRVDVRSTRSTIGATGCCPPTCCRRRSACATSSPASCPIGTTSIAPQLMAGLNVLITAHGNSLRALLKHLEGVSDEEIADVNIPTGVPRRYEFDDRLGVRLGRVHGRRRGDRRGRRGGRRAGRHRLTRHVPRRRPGDRDRARVAAMASEVVSWITSRTCRCSTDAAARSSSAIAKAGDEITMTAGTLIIDQGQMGREAFVVLDGQVTVKRGGRKITSLGPGAMVGELSLLDHGPRTATVVCDTDCTLVRDRSAPLPRRARRLRRSR